LETSKDSRPRRTQILKMQLRVGNHFPPCACLLAAIPGQ
jgi:hypothetical protein